MKKWQHSILALGTTMILVLGMGTTALAAENSGIVVNGKGVVTAQPDIATISLYVEAKGNTAEAAQKENNRAITKVITALENAGIAKDKIITAYSSVSPDYSYNDETGKQTTNGYRAYTSLQATTKDIDNAGKYVDAALAAGASGYNGVSFSLEDPSHYYSQALQVAVKNAATSAQAIATAYNKPLGAVTSVTENSAIAYYEDGIMEKAMADTMAGGSRNSSTSIQYDTIEVTASITVSYGL